jgi:hypothetical protein
MNLQDTIERLLAAKEPVDALEQIDKYIRARERIDADLRIPERDAWLAPVVDAYTGQLDAWVRFIAHVRDDHIAPASVDWQAAHALYRRVLLRATQRSRRERLDRACAKAVELGILADSFDARTAYAKKCTAEWVEHKMLALKERRAGKLHLSVAERAEALEQFWREVDADIERGVLPSP